MARPVIYVETFAVLFGLLPLADGNVFHNSYVFEVFFVFEVFLNKKLQLDHILIEKT